MEKKEHSIIRMGNTIPQVRFFDEKAPFDVYVVTLGKGDKVNLVDAVYVSEELATTHRNGLMSLPHYKGSRILVKRIQNVTSIDQIKDEIGLDSTDLISQRTDLAPHALTALGPMF